MGTLELPPLECEDCKAQLSVLDLDAEAKCPCGSSNVYAKE